MSGKRLGEIGDGVFLEGRSGDERGVGEFLGVDFLVSVSKDYPVAPGIFKVFSAVFCTPTRQKIQIFWCCHTGVIIRMSRGTKATAQRTSIQKLKIFNRKFFGVIIKMSRGRPEIVDNLT